MQLEHGTQKTAKFVDGTLVIEETKQYRWWSNDKKVCESQWFSSIEAAMMWANEKGE